MSVITITPEIYSFNIDSSRHVSNIAYIQWMEIARIKLLDAVGLSLTNIEQAGFAPALTRTDIRYKKPLYLGDQIRVELTFSELKRVSATMHFRFIRNVDEIIAEGWQEGVFFNLQSKRPHKLSEEERQRFDQFLEVSPS